MGEQKLFDFLENAEFEMQRNEFSFFDYWNKVISSNLSTGDSFAIEDYISIFGGFKLSISELCQLDSSMRAFFSRWGKKEGDLIWLRGYSYYECDPQMHKKDEQVNERILWDTFSSHWDRYSALYPLSDQESTTLNVINWIGMLSFLEYLYNDLTTLHWFILSNIKEVGHLPDGEEILVIVENEIDEIANLISGLLLFRFSDSSKVFCLKVNNVISNDALKIFIKNPLKISDFKSGCVRAIREGDSLPLIFSAYIKQLLPFCESMSQKNFLFMSNAFGALNLGVIFKFLLHDQVSVKHINVHYSQHRADVSDIGKESNIVKIYNWSSEKLNDNDACMVVVDDCIFTGKSFCEIKKKFQSNEVWLLPLTLDIQSLKYYERETRDVQEANRIAKYAVLWAGKLGNTLPAFQGFWDWSNVSGINTNEEDKEFCQIVNGGDLLLKTLWLRYRKEIVKTAPKDD